MSGRRRLSLLILFIAAGIFLPASAERAGAPQDSKPAMAIYAGVARVQEVGVDRPGKDYKNFDLPKADPGLCKKYCDDDQNCKAYTYVKPGSQGRSARCWLKSEVPAAVKSDCCISGVKESTAQIIGRITGVAVLPERNPPQTRPSPSRPFPNFVGQSLEEAKRHTYLQVFQVKVETENDYESGLNPGIVSRQSPPPQTSMRLGMALKLWVAAARPPQYRMPDLVGKHIETVRRDPYLLRLRLRIETEDDNSSNLQPGVVTRQSPPAGASIQIGEQVKLWVAIEAVTVPNVERMPLEAARNILLSNRLRFDTTTQTTDSADPNIVLSQRPTAGTRVAPQTVINLTVAIREMVQVPDVTGRPVEEAERLLQRVRLGMGSVEQIRSDQRAGVILSQSPQAGEQVAVGTSVRLTVSAPERPIAPTPDQPGQPSSPPGIPGRDDGGIRVIQWVIGALAVVGAGYLALSLGRRMTRSAEATSPRLYIRSAIGRPEHRVETEGRLTADYELRLRPIAERGVQRLEAAADLAPE
jgi:beta-lactam-binding protein with PASTA domain